MRPNRTRHTKQNRHLLRQLTPEYLDGKDLLNISQAVKYEMYRCAQIVDEAIAQGQLKRAATYEYFAANYNRVLLHLNHPAAIEPNRT